MTEWDRTTGRPGRGQGDNVSEKRQLTSPARRVRSLPAPYRARAYEPQDSNSKPPTPSVPPSRPCFTAGSLLGFVLGRTGSLRNLFSQRGIRGVIDIGTETALPRKLGHVCFTERPPTSNEIPAFAVVMRCRMIDRENCHPDRPSPLLTYRTSSAQ